jgi:hypothetical protein
MVECPIAWQILMIEAAPKARWLDDHLLSMEVDRIRFLLAVQPFPTFEGKSSEPDHFDRCTRKRARESGVFTRRRFHRFGGSVITQFMMTCTCRESGRQNELLRLDRKHHGKSAIANWELSSLVRLGIIPSARDS